MLSLDRNQDRMKFRDYEVVYDVLSAAPQSVANVEWPSGAKAELGNVLTPTQVYYTREHAFPYRVTKSSIIIQYWMILVITFRMIIECYNYHTILDDSCHHFLDDNFTLQLSSNIG